MIDDMVYLAGFFIRLGCIFNDRYFASADLLRLEFPYQSTAFHRFRPMLLASEF